MVGNVLKRQPLDPIRRPYTLDSGWKPLVCCLGYEIVSSHDCDFGYHVHVYEAVVQGGDHIAILVVELSVINQNHSHTVCKLCHVDLLWLCFDFHLLIFKTGSGDLSPAGFGAEPQGLNLLTLIFKKSLIKNPEGNTNPPNQTRKEGLERNVLPTAIEVVSLYNQLLGVRKPTYDLYDRRICGYYLSVHNRYILWHSVLLSAPIEAKCMSICDRYSYNKLLIKNLEERTRPSHL